jgi:hypothetical protein
VTLAGLAPARCAAAEAELAKDAWALAAMGDHAMCLIDAGKTDEARNRLDQLAAITPADWRVSLGRAVLADNASDANTADAAYAAASKAAPEGAIRSGIAAKMKAAPSSPASAAPAPAAPVPVDDKDIQIPLPAAHH